MNLYLWTNLPGHGASWIKKAAPKTGPLHEKLRTLVSCQQSSSQVFSTTCGKKRKNMFEEQPQPIPFFPSKTWARSRAVRLRAVAALQPMTKTVCRWRSWMPKPPTRQRKVTVESEVDDCHLWNPRPCNHCHRHPKRPWKKCAPGVIPRHRKKKKPDVGICFLVHATDTVKLVQMLLPKTWPTGLLGYCADGN